MLPLWIRDHSPDRRHGRLFDCLIVCLHDGLTVMRLILGLGAACGAPSALPAFHAGLAPGRVEDFGMGLEPVDEQAPAPGPGHRAVAAGHAGGFRQAGDLVPVGARTAAVQAPFQAGGTGVGQAFGPHRAVVLAYRRARLPEHAGQGMRVLELQAPHQVGPRLREIRAASHALPRLRRTGRGIRHTGHGLASPWDSLSSARPVFSRPMAWVAWLCRS